MKKNLATVLDYFGYFSYSPSFDEIHTFFPKKISKKNLQTLLSREVQSEKVLQLSKDVGFRLSQGFSNHHSLATNHSRYTLPQYSTQTGKKFKFQIQIKDIKIVKTIQKYIRVLKLFPFIRFVGVTGSSAMSSLRKNDDVDLCVVTKHDLLWSTRFFVIILAKVMGIHHARGVCLNLFFDESDLGTPHKKHNVYIAHELLQMKPIIDKDAVHTRFLAENAWIYKDFPNAPHTLKHEMSQKDTPIRQTMYWYIDAIFKSIQMPIIHRNQTAFYITPTQLWLFKQDFEKKLKKLI